MSRTRTLDFLIRDFNTIEDDPIEVKWYDTPYLVPDHELLL